MAINERELRDAVGQVLRGVDTDRSSQALRAIEDAALEEPEALRPFLLQLHGVASIRHRLLEGWRAADDVAISHLFSVAGGADDHEARDAIRALTYTRRRDVLERLAPIPGERFKRPSGLGFAHEIGYEATDAGLRRLHQAEVLHLTFPPEILKRTKLEWDTSPSWNGFVPDSPGFRFGGRGEAPCGRCGQPIDHLVTFEPIPAAAGISGARITFCVCLSCVFEQNGEHGCRTGQLGAFFRHDGAGRPAAIDVEDDLEPPEFPSAPFVEMTVQLVDHGPRYRVQSWGGTRGNLFRVGGEPSWVQGATYRKCPSCARTMTFVMQLDSRLPTTDGKRYDWANGGMAYVSWCDACRVSHIQLQYT